MVEGRPAESGGPVRKRRLVRFQSTLLVRMEREAFQRVFRAAHVSGADSMSSWMRKVVGEAAARELDRHQRREPLR